MSTFLLIPGAGGASSYWRAVVPQLEAAGNSVVAPDLPASDDSAGLARYLDVALDALDRADVDRTEPLVVVGQSMGAYTAASVCERIPVDLLVLTAPMVPAEGETPGDWWANTGQPDAQRSADLAAGRDPDAEFDAAVTFLHDVPPHVIDELAAAGETDTPQSSTPFADVWSLAGLAGEGQSGASWPDVPTKVVLGSEDRLFPLEFLRDLVRSRLGVEADIIDSGHLIALARPSALAEKLLTYEHDLV